MILEYEVKLMEASTWIDAEARHLWDQSLIDFISQVFTWITNPYLVQGAFWQEICTDEL